MRKIVYLLFAAAFLIALSGIANACVINGGFETGDLSGWTASVEDSPNSWLDIYNNPISYPFDPFTNPVVDYPSVESGDTISPMEGNNVAKISGHSGIGDTGVVASDGTWYTYNGYTTISLSTSVFMNVGDSLWGWIAIETEEGYLWHDHAWVQVTSPTLSETIVDLSCYEARNNNINPEPYSLALSPWYFWEWVAPASNVYNLSLNVYGDDQCVTNAYFDGIGTNSVPEPSTLLLVGLVFLGTGLIRKRFTA